MVEKKSAPIRVSEDVYWYLARYKATKRIRTYSHVIARWFEIASKLSIERQHEIVFDIATRVAVSDVELPRTVTFCVQS